MRLILGFIFFGLLFYLIWIYFPEAFQVLVSWAAKVVDFVTNLINQLLGTSNAPHPQSSKALL